MNPVLAKNYFVKVIVVLAAVFFAIGGIGLKAAENSHDIVIDDFESVTYSGGTLDRGEKKEGEASISYSKSTPGDFVHERVFASPLDLSALSSEKHAYIQAWVYISNPQEWPQMLAFEITSSGRCDVNEYQWNLSLDFFEPGWNQVSYSLTEAPQPGVTGGLPDLTAINYYRFYSVDVPVGTIIKFDDLRLVSYDDTEDFYGAMLEVTDDSKVYFEGMTTLRVSRNLTAAGLKEALSAEGVEMRVLSSNRTAIKDGAKVKTGHRLALMRGGNVINIYNIVLEGDSPARNYPSMTIILLSGGIVVFALILAAAVFANRMPYFTT